VATIAEKQESIPADINANSLNCKL